MGSAVQCLLLKRKELTLDLLKPHKVWVWPCVPVSGAQRDKDRSIPDIFWPVSLASTVSSRLVRDSGSKNKVARQLRKTSQHPPLSFTSALPRLHRMVEHEE